VPVPLAGIRVSIGDRRYVPLLWAGWTGPTEPRTEAPTVSTLQAQVDFAHRLAGRRFQHLLISAFLDLEPSRFSTAPARSSEITSLLDGLHRQLQALPLDHADRKAVTEDAERLDRYLRLELDASGARGLAILCSGQEDLFEVVRLSAPTTTAVTVSTVPQLEPLLPVPGSETVCVALVNRREARFFLSDPARALSDGEEHDQIRGQSHGGGLSQANYERSVEADVDAHLRTVAERLRQLLAAEPFKRLVLGGPHDLVLRFTPMLHADVRALLDPTELVLDVAESTPTQIEKALADVRRGWCRSAQDAALRTILDARPGATHGLAATLAALDQRQVATLVLAPNIDEPGAICATCGLLYSQSEDSCPADGTQLEPLLSLRSAMVRSAVAQDAGVLVLADFDDPEIAEPPLERRPETEAFGGYGALLRY
jgi:peptide chain release factor subunit 1